VRILQGGGSNAIFTYLVAEPRQRNWSSALDGWSSSMQHFRDKVLIQNYNMYGMARAQ
jgi:hypothetical protein